MCFIAGGNVVQVEVGIAIIRRTLHTGLLYYKMDANFVLFSIVVKYHYLSGVFDVDNRWHRVACATPWMVDIVYII